MTLRQTFGARFDPNKEYMTASERALFEGMRSSGELSFYRIGVCKQCGADVLKEKKFCSRQCKENHDETGKMD